MVADNIRRSEAPVCLEVQLSRLGYGISRFFNNPH